MPNRRPRPRIAPVPNVTAREPVGIDTVPLSDLATDWTVDAAAVLILVIATVTWLRLLRRHPSWPRSRTIAGATAIAAALVATQSGVATHDTTSFTAHAIQHVLLGMAVPLLAALAAPVTLVLQAADHGTRAVVRRVLRHRATVILTQPVVGFVVFGASVVLVAFSSLLDAAAESDLVHVWLHAHLVLAGSLFLWPLVAIDPVPQ